MDDQHLYALLKKFNQGQCDAAELERLAQWYGQLGPERPDQQIIPGSAAAQEITQQQLAALRATLEAERGAVAVVPLWKRIARHAALWGGIVLTGAGAYWAWQHQHQAASGTRSISVAASQQTDFNRFILLPDGSKVILHAGSRLRFPEHFSGDTREVTLYGEAYFDIAPQASSRFVINTGRLKTTVLGTAFNISAYPERITVSVTHGKVKVEEERKLLAVLTPDQQIVYNPASASVVQHPVNAASQSSWANADMVFEDASFASIAATLSKRYGVKIIFTNDALKDCPIRATFSGTETLEQVLDVLCTVRNATYERQNGDEISISGAGCSI